MTLRQQFATAAAVLILSPTFGCAPHSARLDGEPNTRVDTAHFLRGRNDQIIHSEDRIVREITETVPSRVAPVRGSTLALPQGTPATFVSDLSGTEPAQFVT